ncbi:glycosyltransferase family 2 protein [Archaeoglobales archaeon]|nr:MAG: glycosyltransferase family 2 protein [Archaeoglobales archaeon]
MRFNNSKNKDFEISVILPTLNEESAIAKCIDEVKEGLKTFESMGFNFDFEIIVADSSTDRTPEIAKEMGAKVVRVDRKGYGEAYIQAFKVAKGDIIVMGDADASYNFKEIYKLVLPIANNEADVVVGSRLKGKIEKNAMPILHRIGNKLLTWFLNVLFDLKISDAHSGFRALKKDAIEKMKLKSSGMEFASEMLVEAKKVGLKIKEVPITYRKRIGKSKLHSLRDGWRHMRFMMLYKPHPLLIYPGIILTIFGLFVMSVLYFRGEVEEKSMHSFILGAIAFLTGFNSFLFGIMISAYSTMYGYSSSNIAEKILNYHSLEKEIIVGFLMILFGFFIGIRIVYIWIASGFGSLSQVASAVLSLTLISAGIMVVYSAFFLSMLLLSKE